MRRVHKKRIEGWASLNEQGAVLVELAMMLPLLVILIVGTIDLGLVIRESQLLQNAAREGARFSALQKNQIGPTNPGATEAAIKQRVIDYLAQENITISAASITVTQTYPIAIGGLTVYASSVTVTYPRSLLIPAAPLIPLGEVTLSGRGIFRNLY